VRNLKAINADTFKTLTHWLDDLPSPQLPCNEYYDEPIMPANLAFLPKSIIKNLPNTLKITTLSLLSDTQAAQLLGLCANQLNDLARNQIIDYIPRGPLYIYSLNQVDEWLATFMQNEILPINTEVTKLISINEIDKVGGQFGAKYLYSFAETFALIIKEKLPLYCIKKNNELSDIYVDRKQLHELLQNNIHKQFSTLLSKSALSKFFCIGKDKVLLLAKIFNWKSIAVNRVNSAYQPGDICDFFDNYLILDKWCDERIYPKARLYQYLRDNNLYPIEGGEDTRCVLHIFKKSKQLYQVIDSFEKDWLKCKPPRHLPIGFDKSKPNFYKQTSNHPPINHELINRQFSLALQR